MDWLEPIINNGDQLGAFTTLLIAFGLLITGLATGYVEIGPPVKERKEALKEANGALKEVKAELHKVETDLIRLQLEKDLLWRVQQNAIQQPQLPASPSPTVNRKRVRQ